MFKIILYMRIEKVLSLIWPKFLIDFAYRIGMWMGKRWPIFLALMIILHGLVAKLGNLCMDISLKKLQRFVEV